MSEFRGREFKIIIAVLLLSGSFLFFGNVKNSKAALLNSYTKVFNDTLTAQEWNNLASDFLKTYGPVSMTGPLGVGTTTIPGSGILVDGPIIASNFSGFLTGGIDAANVIGGPGSIFGSTFGSGASYSFSGNVGIGTSTPGAKLDVIGSLRASSATITSVNSGVVMADGSGNLYATSSAVATGIPVGSNGQTLRSNGTNWLANSLLFNDGTNIGIGTTTMSAMLGIQGSGSDILNLFDSTGVEKVSILNSGNVGIGTASPSAKLDVRNETLNNAAFQTLATVFANVSNESSGETFDPAMSSFGLSFRRNWSSSAGSTNVAGIYGFSSGGWRGGMVFRTKNNTNSAGDTDVNAMVLSPAGNVGIGTTNPGAKLEVFAGADSSNDLLAAILSQNGENGTILNFNNAFGPLASITGTKKGTGSAADEGNLVFKTATNSVLAETMRIDNLGNVGIGTTAPDATLDIGGAIASFRANSATLSNIGSGVIMADASGNLYSTSTAAATGMPSPSGIAGQTLRSNGTNWLANSLLFNDGTNIGVGTTTATYKLEVDGSFSATSNASSIILDASGNISIGI